MRGQRRVGSADSDERMERAYRRRDPSPPKRLQFVDRTDIRDPAQGGGRLKRTERAASLRSGRIRSADAGVLRVPTAGRLASHGDVRVLRDSGSPRCRSRLHRAPRSRATSRRRPVASTASRSFVALRSRGRRCAVRRTSRDVWERPDPDRRSTPQMVRGRRGHVPGVSPCMLAPPVYSP